MFLHPDLIARLINFCEMYQSLCTCWTWINFVLQESIKIQKSALLSSIEVLVQQLWNSLGFLWWQHCFALSAALSLIYMIMYHHSLLHLVVQRLSTFPSSDTLIWFFLLSLLSSIIIELLLLVFNKLFFFMVSFFIKLSTINCFYLCH